MKKIMLLEDINLAGIQFSDDGKNIYIDYLDMCDGKPIARMTCEDVIQFNFSNNFSNRHGFACYVGEVTVQSFTSQESISQLLLSMRYSFHCVDMKGNVIALYENLYLIDIEGGEISLNILCKKNATLHLVGHSTPNSSSR